MKRTYGARSRKNVRIVIDIEDFEGLRIDFLFSLFNMRENWRGHLIIEDRE